MKSSAPGAGGSGPPPQDPPPIAAEHGRWFRPSSGDAPVPPVDAGGLHGARPPVPGWRTWLLIGATGFGGPAGQIALLHRELVERAACLREDEFVAAMRLCMLLPGPEAQQLATYAGWRLGGLRGGLVAGTLFVLPGAILVTLLAWLHAAGGRLPLVGAAFAGTRPAVVALVLLAAWRIGRRSLRSPLAGCIALAAGAALAGGAGFPLTVLAAGAVGFLLPPGSLGESPAPPGASPGPAPRADRGIRRLLLTGVTWTLVWIACLAVVVAVGAAGGRGGAIAVLFTETTLLSLGGAYAVVPWALDESLARGWLEPAERGDGLALGEATPGPLILVVTFIGFLAGWKTTAGGDPAAGLAGAAVATLFAFLPSFGLVFALAPVVDSLGAAPRASRSLTAIGCVVVAAIVLLAVHLGRDTLLPGGRPAVLPLVVAGVSLGLLTRGRAATPLVVLAAAAVGVLT